MPVFTARAVPDAALVSKAVALVRGMNGLMGAASLGRSTGLSRRQAAAVKQAEQTAMERERQAACTRVVVTTPGIVRGFDQMYVWTRKGWRFPLVSARTEPMASRGCSRSTVSWCSRGRPTTRATTANSSARTATIGPGSIALASCLPPSPV